MSGDDSGNRKRSWSLPGLKIDIMRRSSVGASDAPRSPFSAGDAAQGTQSPRPTSFSPRTVDSPRTVEGVDSPSTPDSFVRSRLTKGINPDLLTFLNSPF